MLNFYNYYGKMHPELIKRLKDIESKLCNFCETRWEIY